MRGLFTLLLIVFLVLLGLGLYLDWFRFLVNRNAEGQGTGVTFQVNREKIARDTEKLGQEVRHLGKKVQQQAHKGAAPAPQAVKGKLMNVDQAEHRLLIKTGDNHTLTVVTGPKTKISRHAVEVPLNELMEGDHLEVLYREENGKHVAESITVDPDA
jgi:hypothetical protein